MAAWGDEMTASRVLVEHFDSQVLKGNRLGDPTNRRVAVYLPPDYEGGSGRFPVVFLLAGFSGRGTMMMNESAWDENIQARLDRLIGTRSIMPMIAVLPDCFTRFGGSQYINSVGTGRYQDHIVQELVPWVDKEFRTIPDRNFRAIAGKSSGGYGSIILGMLHPETFGSVASHSGDMYFELCYGPDLIRFVRTISKFGGLDKFLQGFRDIRPKDGDFYAVLETIAMASCYSPDPDSGYGFDLPLDEYTAEWKKDVWARWKEWDPIELIDSHIEALRSLSLLYLDCGTRDEYNLQFGARTFCSRLQKRGIAYRYEEFEDGHRDVQYRYDTSLAAISRVWGNLAS
jgi:S-formylglutathione hydrolase FrmB